MRKTHSKEFKFRVALEAIRGDMTIAQIVSRYQVAESLVHRWRKQLLAQGESVFESRRQGTENDYTTDIEKLHAKIGQLTLENAFLEKVLGKGR